MRRLVPVLFLALLLVPGLPREAKAGFIGGYDVSNWTTTLTGSSPGGSPGSVNTSGAPTSINILGGYGGCTVLNTCTVGFTIPALGGGVVTFHWEYQTADVDGPAFDFFGQTVNGAFSQLSDNSGADSQSGNASFPVSAGAVFGFKINCTDCIYGSANVTISDFSGPTGALSPSPEPGTLLLFSTGLAGVAAGAWRRRTR